ncbi:hypothetical protein [Rhizobium sullae]|nr:hypothetical protein [Rhizobium sullae]
MRDPRRNADFPYSGAEGPAFIVMLAIITPQIEAIAPHGVPALSAAN